MSDTPKGFQLTSGTYNFLVTKAGRTEGKWEIQADNGCEAYTLFSNDEPMEIGIALITLAANEGHRRYTCGLDEEDLDA